jgi:hypothetical protein
MKKIAIFSALIICGYFVSVPKIMAQNNAATVTKPETTTVPKTDKNVVSKDAKTQSSEQNKAQVQSAKTTDTKTVDKAPAATTESSKQNPSNKSSLTNLKTASKPGVYTGKPFIKKLPPDKEKEVKEDDTNKK